MRIKPRPKNEPALAGCRSLSGDIRGVRSLSRPIACRKRIRQRTYSTEVTSGALQSPASSHITPIPTHRRFDRISNPLLFVKRGVCYFRRNCILIFVNVVELWSEGKISARYGGYTPSARCAASSPGGGAECIGAPACLPLRGRWQSEAWPVGGYIRALISRSIYAQTDANSRSISRLLTRITFSPSDSKARSRSRSLTEPSVS